MNPNVPEGLAAITARAMAKTRAAVTPRRARCWQTWKSSAATPT
ncbi:MAG: hypothetical protein ACLRRT_07445 [Ruthenibacterium lactatiformans]